MTLTCDNQNQINSSLSPSGHLGRISLKAFLTYCFHENWTNGKLKNIMPLATAIADIEA